MNIKCKLISFEGKREYKNDFEFEMDHKTPIASTEDKERSIVMLSGHPYTIGIPYEELKSLKKESKTDKNGTRDYS